MVDFKQKTQQVRSSGQQKQGQRTSGPQKTINTIPGEEAWYMKPRIILGLILVLTAIVYSNALTNGFLSSWDDAVYVTSNPDIKAWNSANIKNWFTQEYSKNYQPVTVITYALEYALAGDKSAFLYHLDNLLIHLINIILAFWLFSMMTRKKWFGLLMAAFFAVHPMHVESVAWISERKDVLYTTFYLLSMGFYYKYLFRGLKIDEKNSGGADKKLATKYLLLSMLFLILSIVSKPAAIVLPGVLVLMDFLYKRKLTVRLILEKVPFFMISLIFALVMMRTQSEGIRSMTFYTTFQKLLLINGSVLRYLYMAIIPVPASTFHPYPSFVNGKVLPDLYYIAPLFTVLIAGVALMTLRKSRVLAFGLGFFVVNLILILQFVPIGYSVIAERYTYVPYFGIFFIISHYLILLWENRNKSVKLVKNLSGGIVIIVILIFSIDAFSRNTCWKNDISLWTDACEKYPNSAFFAFYKRGLEYSKKEDTKAKAYADFSQAIEIKPNYRESLYTRGILRADSGNIKGALEDYDKALAADKRDWKIFNSRGDARRQLGDLKGAMEDFQKALEMSPGDTLIIFNMGMVKAASGDLKGALDDYNKALEKGTRFSYGYNNRGAAREMTGDYPGALQDYSKAVEVNPKYADALFNRGNLRTKMQDLKGAADDMRKVIKINQKYYAAYVKLGNLLVNLNEKTEACEVWKSGADIGIQNCKDAYEKMCK